MRRPLTALVGFLLASVTAHAQSPPPPPPCPGAVSPQPSHLRITYVGSISGCTETAGVCLPGETIQFTAVHLVDFNCSLVGNAWIFGDGTPFANGKIVTHTFMGPGSYSVQLTVAVLSETATVTQTVLVAGAPIPTLNQLGGAALVIGLAFIALAKLH